jgi:hypothetical protein
MLAIVATVAALCAGAPASIGILAATLSASATNALEVNGPMPMADDPHSPRAPRREAIMPPPRHPDIAVREEFEMARAKNTAAALALFIERHADHPLADEARRILKSLGADRRL